MTRPTRTLAPAAAKSPERTELETLALKLSPEGHVDAYTNPNGHVVVIECVRADKRVVRLYSEGASTLAAAERVVLAGLREMVGVRW